jgi:hypothetical protein
MPPPDPFLEQNAPDLTPLHLYALLMGSGSQGIQTPMSILLRLYCLQVISHPHRLAGWVRARQSDDPPSLLLSKASLPPGSWSITQAIHPFGVEPSDSFAHGLRMAAKLRGNHGGALVLPTADNHLRAQDPIGWRMTTPGQFPDLAFFLLILGWSGK